MSINLISSAYKDMENGVLILIEDGATKEEIIDHVKNIIERYETITGN